MFILLPASVAAHSDRALRASVSELAGLLTDGYARLDKGRLYSAKAANLVAVIFFLQEPAKGNGSWEFLAFFEENTGLSQDAPVSSSYRLLAVKQIGSKGLRLFDSGAASFKDGKLIVPGNGYKPADPECCPSLPIRSEFTIKDGQIIEQQIGG
jgi:hypothetical protein